MLTFDCSPLVSGMARTSLLVTIFAMAGCGGGSPPMIGPRPPAQRDMRFKHVQLAPTLEGLEATGISAVIPGDISSKTFISSVGSTLMVGNQDCGTSANLTSCAWLLQEYAAPAGIQGFNSAYLGDVLTDLDSDLAGLGTNSVLTSLDEQNGPGFAYGVFVSSVETDPTVSGGFTMQRVTVTDATLATTVSAMAAKGVVVTAASVNSVAGIDLVAYSWSGDQGTTYDAQTVLTTYVNLGPQALNLAQQGYIITAVGTADANQMLLVGTKVHGDTRPRNLAYAGSQVGGTSSDGQIVVGYVFGNDAGNNPNLSGFETVLAQ